MKEITFEATFEVPHLKQSGLLLKTAEGQVIQIVSSKDWVRYFELFISRSGSATLPYPLGFTLAPALSTLGVEVVRAELVLKRVEGTETAFAVLVLKDGDGGEEVCLQTRASEAIMVCLQASKPIFAHDNLIWHSAPKTFFDGVTPDDFVKFYQKKMGMS